MAFKESLVPFGGSHSTGNLAGEARIEAWMREHGTTVLVGGSTRPESSAAGGAEAQRGGAMNFVQAAALEGAGVQVQLAANHAIEIPA